MYTKIKYLLYLELIWKNKRLSLKIPKIFSLHENINKMTYQEIIITCFNNTRIIIMNTKSMYI
jgi:hypothetical protein